MDFEVLKKLIQLAKDEDVSGLSVEDKGVKYEVKREKGHTVPSHQPSVISHQPENHLF
jgi:hypothetical protein